MANMPDYALVGIPRYDTPLTLPGPGGNLIIHPSWYRFWRSQDTAVTLIQDTLANRPDAANYNDGSVLFIDTDTSFMYYVASGVWVKVLT